MKNTKLKQALFTSPQSGTTKFGRYVVENEADFKKFLRVFDLLKRTKESIRESLREGRIIILTEPNTWTGYPSYCFESKDPNDTHPSSFHRVK